MAMPWRYHIRYTVAHALFPIQAYMPRGIQFWILSNNASWLLGVWREGGAI